MRHDDKLNVVLLSLAPPREEHVFKSKCLSAELHKTLLDAVLHRLVKRWSGLKRSMLNLGTDPDRVGQKVRTRATPVQHMESLQCNAHYCYLLLLLQKAAVTSMF